MKFPSIKDWLLENKNDGVTILIPGGFKPLTGGHIFMIEKYAKNPDVKEVRVIVGPKTRNGIDQELGVKIAKELTSHLPNVKVETSKYPSPLLTAYKEIENLKPGRYALGASSKGDDYKRVVDFTQQHQPGGKYYEGVPEGVSIEELAVNADPALFLDGPHKGQPISASTLRADVMEGDYEAFASGYPLNDEKQIKKVWDMLQGVVINESYNYLYINEEAILSGKNTHMTHAEDLVILGGKKGMDWVLKMMWDLYQNLKGHTEKENVKLSVKIDGAPAITAWSSFPNLPDYGIAMKGLFAKTPKVFTNDKEIDENFGDRPSLGYKLKTFLKYLKDIKIPAGEIWQGDFLFDDKSIQETEINGEPHWAFHPNTIYYVVPKDSDLGKLIDKAEVGIAWHTRYTGPNLENVQANYDTDASELQMIDKLMMTDPYIKSFAGKINFTAEESDNVEKTLEELLEISKNLGNSPVYKKLLDNKNLISLFTIFQNSLIKSNIKMGEMDPDGFINEFIEFLQNRGSKEADKMKSEKGKEKKLEAFAELIDFIQQNKDDLYLLIHMIIEITRLKEMFVRKLNHIGQFQTYLKMKEGGIRGTNQEGFACSDIDGNVVKLVSRDEFSYANFSPEVQKGWLPS
jgi:hypothetical protein